VRVDKVKYLDLSSDIYVDGRISAGNEVTLYSKVQGIVLKKYKIFSYSYYLLIF
ncbi:hypothetical protein EZS27_031231, partial [termite gut metagenome]